MKGFDYDIDQPLDLPPREWKAKLQALVAKGGRRKVVEGETWGIHARGVIAFEIYGNIQLPETKNES